MKSKIVLITGASSGIGRACALKCAQEGYSVILCARREERLKELQEEMETLYQREALICVMDVSRRDEVVCALEQLPAAWKAIDVLINNAGLSLGMETLDQGDPEDWETMIDVNLKGLLYVTQSVITGMLARNRGHIINIGSISSREGEVYPGGAVYCATKRAVRALSEGMKKDWHGTNIRVTEIDPGFAETEFSLIRFKQDQQKADAVYHNTIPLVAEDIAEAVYFCLSRPPHVNIREIFLTSTAQSSNFMIHRRET